MASCSRTPNSPIPFFGCCPVIPAAKNLVQFVATAGFWGFQPITPQGDCHPLLYTRFRAVQIDRNGISGNYTEIVNPKGGLSEVTENTIPHPNYLDSIYSVFVSNASASSATFESKADFGSGLEVAITTTLTVDQPYGNEAADFQALIDALGQYYDEPIPTGNDFTMIGACYDIFGTLIHGEDAVLDGSFGLPDAFEICGADTWLYRKQSVFDYPTFTPVNSTTGFIVSPAYSLFSLSWCRAKIRITAPWYQRDFNNLTLLGPDGCTVVRSEYCEGGAASCEQKLVAGTDEAPVIFTPSGNYNEYAQYASHTECPEV